MLPHVGPESIVLEVAERSDPGRDPNKQVNEDAAGHCATALGHLLVVCDGMGGHALGQEASRLAVQTILRVVDAMSAGAAPGPALRTAISEAGRLVYEMGGTGPQPARPGSTCVAMLVHAGGAEVAHVGDSRAYLLRRHQIWQTTRDHSVVQQLLDRGAISAEQAAIHPEANKITRALGMKPDTEVDLREPPLACEPGDVFVLATDGLCDLVPTDEIGKIVDGAPTLDAACEELIRLANLRGGHDNITVQMARLTSQPRARAGGIAPTLVETPALPEKTLIDPLPAVTAPGLAGLAVGSGGPEPLPPLRPAPLPLPSGPHTPLPAAPRAGCLVLVVGIAIGALVIAIVVTWWLWKGVHG
jgi:serine/threonine protein phosphatase PrpC